MSVTSGWKTYASAALMMIYGIGGAFVGIHSMDTGIELFIGGFGLLGLGHKLDKVVAVTKDPNAKV